MIRIGFPFAVILGFAAMALAFAMSQSIWVDETTQLSGLMLAFVPQLDWLTGGHNPIPGVPPDRMPPLSYWLGSAWAGIFGFSEASMRIFGIVAMLCGAPAIYLSALALGRGGRDAFLPGIALAIAYLAPTTIVQAGEIRAYPLYFAFAAWAVLAYLRALMHPDRRFWLLLLGLFCLAAGYTHFFGVVMAGLLWLSLLGIRLARREPAGLVLVGGLATAALFAGLLPFILAAVELSSKAASERPGLTDAAEASTRLLTRLWLHGSHLSSAPIFGSALLGLAILIVLALFGVMRSRTVQGIGLLLPMALAFVTLPLMKLTIGQFDVLAPHYNIWLVPLAALFVVTAIAEPRMRGLALGAAALLIGSHLAADYRLIQYAEFYSHGPGEWIAGEITDPSTTIVIHDHGSNWGQSYFPIHFLTDGRVTQVLRDATGPDQIVTPAGLSEHRGSVMDFATRIYVRTRALSSIELSRLLTDAGDCGIPAMTPDSEGTARTLSRCSFEGATMVIVQQSDEP